MRRLENRLLSMNLKTKLIHLNQGPVERGEEPPDMRRQRALDALKYARDRSIFLEEAEANQLKTAIQNADMTATFNPHTKEIPDRIIVDFFSQNPPWITLNEIIVAVREKKNQNPNAPFTEIFKIALAYRDRLINKFE